MCSTPSNCTQCIDSYGMMNSVCEPCEDAKCLECSDTTFCDSCQAGYASVSGVCVKCGNMCLKCSSSSSCT